MLSQQLTAKMWGNERESQNVWLCKQFLLFFFYLMERFYLHSNPSAICLSAELTVRFCFECTFCAVFLYQTILGGIWCGAKAYENIISLPVFFPESTFVSLLLSLILQTCSNRSLFSPLPPQIWLPLPSFLGISWRPSKAPIHNEL